MNFAQIRAFYCVFREGGVGRAADILNVSQPTVSQHLKGLEEQTNARLFERRGRGLTLTPDGQTLFVAAERLMRAASDVDDVLAQETTLADGKLHILADSPPLVVELLARFRRRFRGVEVSIAIASKDAIMTALTDRVADLGVSVEPTVGGEWVGIPLRSDGLAVCVARDHPFAAASELTLRHLATEVVIVREASSRTRILLEELLAKFGVTLVERIEIAGRCTIREAVAKGIGVSVFAASECPPDPRLAHIPLHQGGTSLAFHEHLVFRRAIQHRPDVAAFVAVAQDYAAQQITDAT